MKVKYHLKEVKPGITRFLLATQWNKLKEWTPRGHGQGAIFDYSPSGQFKRDACPNQRGIMAPAIISVPSGGGVQPDAGRNDVPLNKSRTSITERNWKYFIDDVRSYSR